MATSALERADIAVSKDSIRLVHATAELPLAQSGARRGSLNRGGACRSVSERVGACRSVSERVEACRGVSERVVACRGVSWRVEARRSASKRVRACRSVSERVGACRSVSERVGACRSASWRVEACRSVSWRVVARRGASERVEACRGVSWCVEARCGTRPSRPTPPQRRYTSLGIAKPRCQRAARGRESHDTLIPVCIISVARGRREPRGDDQGLASLSIPNRVSRPSRRRCRVDEVEAT